MRLATHAQGLPPLHTPAPPRRTQTLKTHCVVLQVCILDGFGSNTEDQWNGIHMAETPVFDSLRKNKERFRWVAAGRSALGGQEADYSAGQAAIGASSDAGRMAGGWLGLHLTPALDQLCRAVGQRVSLALHQIRHGQIQAPLVAVSTTRACVLQDGACTRHSRGAA